MEYIQTEHKAEIFYYDIGDYLNSLPEVYRDKE